MRIEEALEKSIPQKGHCKICPHKFENTCDITEEKIGSGETYCDLREPSFWRRIKYRLVQILLNKL